MIRVELKPLLDRLNAYSKKSLENAAGVCMTRSNYEVSVEHMLLVMVDDTERDFQLILRHYGIEPAHMKRELTRAVEDMRTGNEGKPVFSPMLLDWFSDAWMLSSVELGLSQVRSGTLIASLIANAGRFQGGYMDRLSEIPIDELRRTLLDIVAGSKEEAAGLASKPIAAAGPGPDGAAAGPSEDSFLGRFCDNLTARGRAGEIDPVFARDTEMREMIDILGRRRKNNPICVGEPGTGKSAVVEGLALKMAQGDVPDFLKNVDLLSLDLGLLQAGAGVKGEFENRLRGVIDEVKASPKPLVLFIDEAHTLIGAGGAAGGSDASNLLKPALARGELRTIAATTWSEYKKYFEKDPALARRFQLVKLDEPSPDDAVTILRGLRDVYEQAHKVYIRDDGIDAAAKMSARYISGRQLPDKAVDVLDTASARVHLSLSGKPEQIDSRERSIATLERELAAIRRDALVDMADDDERMTGIEDEIASIREELTGLAERWDKEKTLVHKILALRHKLGIDLVGGDDDAPEGDADPASGGATDGTEATGGDTPDEADAAPDDAPDGAAEVEPATDDGAEPIEETTAKILADAAEMSDDPEVLKKELADARAELEEIQGREPLIHYEVTPDAVSEVIADWTGIPTGSMVRDEADSVLSLGTRLKERVIGQDHAVQALDEGLRAAKAGLNNPNAPMGVFLFVGPSGVGKTEMATAVADQMFGGERFMCAINMSEFQEKHTVSRLVGSPPGYVGYGEGGVLTEAVRQRPYSVVLLDEVEKADLEVMNLFYQVFDKGVLNDGEGRTIDFKNTVVFLTSNLATDILTQMGLQDPRPDMGELTDAIRPTLSNHFKPALLARMQIVPFYPLVGEAIGKIAKLKLNIVAKRLMASQHMVLDFDDAVVQQIADRCTEVETGARNIDHIINRTMLPEISTQILERMAEDARPDRIQVSVGDDGNFAYSFESNAS